jgi:hypothetical protein
MALPISPEVISGKEYVECLPGVFLPPLGGR